MKNPIRVVNPRPSCHAEDCTRKARTAGYCPRHYQQIRRHGRLTPERKYQQRGVHCQASGCQQSEVPEAIVLGITSRSGGTAVSRPNVSGSTAANPVACPVAMPTMPRAATANAIIWRIIICPSVLRSSPIRRKCNCYKPHRLRLNRSTFQ